MRDRKTTTKWFSTKWVLGVAAAGALFLAAPAKSQAQVSLGVEVGNYPPPAYGYYEAPAQYPYDSYQRQRWIEHEQRERWEAERAAHWRHEQWERERRYDHDGWRDRDRRDYDRDRRDRDDRRDRW